MIFRVVVMLAVAVMMIIGCLPRHDYGEEENFINREDYSGEKLFRANDTLLNLYNNPNIKEISIKDSDFCYINPISGLAYLMIPIHPGDTLKTYVFNIMPDTIVAMINIKPSRTNTDTTAVVSLYDICQLIGSSSIYRLITFNNGTPIFKSKIVCLK